MSYKDLEAKVSKIFSDLNSLKTDWEIRRQALIDLKELIYSPQYANVDWSSLISHGNGFQLTSQMTDNRSSIVSAACEAVEALSKTGPSIAERMSYIYAGVLEKVGSGNTVISSYCQKCCINIVSNRPFRKLFSYLAKNINSPNDNMKTCIIESTCIACESWPIEYISGNQELIQIISSTIGGASQIVRDKARDAYIAVQRRDPTTASSIYAKLDSSTQFKLDSAVQSRKSTPDSTPRRPIPKASPSPSPFTNNTDSMSKTMPYNSRRGVPKPNYISKTTSTTLSDRPITSPINITNININATSPNIGNTITNKQFIASSGSGMTSPTINSPASLPVPSLVYPYSRTGASRTTKPISNLPIRPVVNTDIYKTMTEFEGIRLNAHVIFNIPNEEQRMEGEVKYIGIEADRVFNKGGTSVIGGITFFSCQPGKAIFLKPSSVIPIDSPSAAIGLSVPLSVRSAVPIVPTVPIMPQITPSPALNSDMEELYKILGAHRLFINDSLDQFVDQLNMLSGFESDTCTQQQKRTYYDTTIPAIKKICDDAQELLKMLEANKPRD
ncbi:hypothetical protein WA158_008384 [Blastocystis sp. Blastoise]